MITKLKQWFNTRFKSEDSEHDLDDLHIAAAILLLEVSRADADISEHEKATMMQVMQQQFAMSDQQIDALLTHIEAEQDEYTSAHPFIRLLNEGLSQAEKQTLLEGLWQVALSDEVLDKYEEYSIRKVSEWLYISHSDFIRTKVKVQQALGLD